MAIDKRSEILYIVSCLCPESEMELNMRIQGFQKLTLLDYPGLVACTVFTGGCNFRCPFCHNAPLVLPGQEPPLETEEVLDILRRRRGLLDGVCVSGGEPLLQPDIGDFLQKLRDMGYRIKLDTNGSFPQRLRALIETGLVDMVAMDIKNAPEKYAQTVGVPGFDLGPVKESAALLMEGRVDFEFRTTVVKPLHEAEDFAKIGRWLQGARNYYLQQFRDSGALIDARGLGAYTEEEMKLFAETAKPFIPHTYLRGMD